MGSEEITVVNVSNKYCSFEEEWRTSEVIRSTPGAFLHGKRSNSLEGKRRGKEIKHMLGVFWVIYIRMGLESGMGL